MKAFQEFKKYLKKKKQIKNSLIDIHFTPANFFFENGCRTNFEKVRMNEEGVLMLDELILNLKKKHPAEDSYFIRGMASEILRGDVEAARQLLIDKYGKEYDPAEAIYAIGGSIHSLYNNPSTQESKFKYQIGDVLARLTPITTEDDRVKD